MFVPFSELPASSRIWIYLANSEISLDQEGKISEFLSIKFSELASHGTGLRGGYTIIENRFLILSIDEGHYAASGCSIDSTVKWLVELGALLGIDFLSRSQVKKEKSGLVFYPALGIKKYIDAGEIKVDDLFFDTLLQQKQQLEKEFLKPAELLFPRFFKITV
jgi:hypothetical protein